MLTIALPLTIPVQDVSAFFNAEVHIWRADTIHPDISGNKWFKLYYYLRQALQENKKGIVTFGGAWSNHIVATAAACATYRLESRGIIRGEEPVHYSATLQQAADMGMQLQFVSRAQYKEKEMLAVPEDYLLIPEGGYGVEGMKGAARLMDYMPGYTHYCCAAGTGTTLAGLIMAAGAEQKITGINVLKNEHGLNDLVAALLPTAKTNWDIRHDFHFGGYAKYTAELLRFMNLFFEQTNIPSDFVYTGKLFFAVQQLIRSGYFPPGSRIALLHSGGLQGNRSLPKGTLMF